MNAITAIGLENVKGFTRDMDIGKLTCIVGRNEAGKSALLFGPSLAIQGTAPQPLLGKGPGAVAKMASSDAMVAAITCEDGFSIRRDFTRNPKTNSVTQKLTVPGVNGDCLTAAQKAIDEALGTATWMFNVAEFATMTDSAKQAFILAICAAGGKASSHSVARLKLGLLENLLPEGTVGTFVGALYQHPIEECTPEELADASEKLQTQLAPSLADALTNIVGPRLFAKAPDPLTANALVGILDAAKQSKNDARKQAREATATVRSLEAKRTAAGVGTERVEEIQKKSAAFTAQVNDLERKLGEIAAHTPALATAKRQVDAKTKAAEANGEALVAIKERIAAIPDKESQSVDLRAKADQAEAEVPEVTAVDAALLEKQKVLTTDYDQGKGCIEHFVEEIDRLEEEAAEIGECKEVTEPTVDFETVVEEHSLLKVALAENQPRDAEMSTELARLAIQTEAIEAKLKTYAADPWRKMGQLFDKLQDMGILRGDEETTVLGEMRGIIVLHLGDATDNGVQLQKEAKNALAKATKKLTAQHDKTAKLIKKQEKRLAQLEAEIEEGQAHAAAYEKYQSYLANREAIQKATENHKKAVERVEECRKQLAALSIKVEGQEALVEEGRKLQKDKAAFANKCRNEADELDRTIKGIHKDHKQAKADAEKIKEELVAAEAEVKRIETELGTLGPAETMEAQKQATNEEISKLDTAMERRREYETIGKNYAAEVSQAKCAEATAEVAAAAEAAAKAMRSSLISDQAAPLLAKVNAFLATAYPGHTAYCDLVTPTGSIACEFGVVSEGGVRVQWEAFSGWQSAMFGAALVYAFSTMQERPLRVLTVEMDGVDAGNRLALMQALAAVGADLSNVLVATCWPFSDEHAEALTQAGWGIINIEEKTHE